MENRILKKYQERKTAELDIFPCSIKSNQASFIVEEYTPIKKLDHYQNFSKSLRYIPQKTKSIKNYIIETKISEFGKKLIANPLKINTNQNSFQKKLHVHGVRTESNSHKIDMLLKQNMALKNEIQKKQNVIMTLRQNENKLKYDLNNKEKLIEILNDKIMEDSKNSLINKQQVINEKEQIIENLKYSLQQLQQQQIKREKELKKILKAFHQTNQIVQIKQKLIKQLKQEIEEIKFNFKHRIKFQKEGKIIETKKKDTNPLIRLKSKSKGKINIREFQISLTSDNTEVKKDRSSSFGSLKVGLGFIKAQKLRKENENKKIDNFNKLINNINFDFYDA